MLMARYPFIPWLKVPLLWLTLFVATAVVVAVVVVVAALVVAVVAVVVAVSALRRILDRCRCKGIRSEQE